MRFVYSNMSFSHETDIFRCTPDEVLPDGARMRSTSRLHWDTEVGKDAITRAIKLAKPAGARVVFDVADPFAVERYRADFLALIREHVDIGDSEPA